MTDTTDDYGYLLVHFIEDPDGYAEKIYMDISDGDNPHRWVPLNDGKPVLASHLGTTGVRDPHIIRNPDTGTWYIIATDLRVFGGDGGGWYEWSHHASTNLIIWESDDLLHWSKPRMLDVSRKPDGSHLELGMAWACECLWVPDYYPQGHHGGRGAFVMYWSSTVFNDADKAHDDKNVYCTVLWGATTDFTQDTFEYGGVFIDNHGDAIDTTMIQRPLPDGNPGGVEGPAVFANHHNNGGPDDEWYLFVDVIPSIGYRPMASRDLDQGWMPLQADDYFLTAHTKHGGVASLTRAEYDRLAQHVHAF